MSKYNGKHLPKSLARKLVDLELVTFSPENHHALWFDDVLTLSIAQCACFQVLWNNFLFYGNLPIPGGRVLNGYVGGNSSHLADLFKRNPAWKEIIVGNGKGQFWLRLPDDLEERIARAEAKLQNAGNGSLLGHEGEAAQ
jgi:hypothetical protein